MAFWNEEKTSTSDENIEQALQSIRDTITKDNKVPMSDVLELTEVIEAGAAPAELSSNNQENYNVGENIDEPTTMEGDETMANSFESILLGNSAEKTQDNVESMLSPEVKAKSQNMLEQFLNQTMPEKMAKESTNNNATTLEDFAREALRKEIAIWINDNLPDMVRTIIEKEIKNLIKQ